MKLYCMAIFGNCIYYDEKEKTGTPKAIIHDGLTSYNDAFQKEYFYPEVRKSYLAELLLGIPDLA